MARRRLLILLVAASAALSATALAQDAPQFVPERATRCYDCHSGAAYGDSPPVSTFLTFVLPTSAGAPVGTPFTYDVSLQNAWTADLTYLEPRLDLNRAPSLAFVSDLPPLHVELPGNLTVDAAHPTEPQAADLALDVPVGMTHLLVRLEPNDRDGVTGPDLALRVSSGGASVTLDHAGRGGVEELDLTQRSDFSALGYGNWTVSAVLTPVRTDPAGLLNSSAPRPSVAFRVVADGGATDTGERILGLPSRQTVPRAGSHTFSFVLVALRPPQAGETVQVDALAHVVYEHPPTAQAVDDADLSKAYAEPVPVQSVGDRVELSATTVAVAPPVQNGATMATIAEAVGYLTAFLLPSSTVAGGMFGKASRRWANALFGTARRRVAFHNFLSYGLILAALAHTTLFLVEAAYAWTIGLLWGGLAALSMLGLGVTGALQVPMIRRWHYATWRWSHYGLAVATMLFTLAHLLLDGAHFDDVQRLLGWRDPITQALG